MPDAEWLESPWIVEIDGVKFATPSPVVELLKNVSEERDELLAENERLRLALKTLVEDIEYHGHGSEMNQHLHYCRRLADA